jgi:hypothetical protein
MTIRDKTPNETFSGLYSPEAKATSCLHKGHESDKLTPNVTDVGHMLDSCAKALSFGIYGQ